MSENKKDLRVTWVDPDDAPELDSSFFDVADEYRGAILVRASRGRPLALETKERISIRLSPAVLKEFRATGPGWQGRIDSALKDWLQSHKF